MEYVASSIQRVAVSGAEASPWTLAPSTPLTLWHLFSLDAPTVAALWTWFAARATHTALPLAVPIAMFVFVWALYAADRLLDARPHPDSSDFSLPASLPSDPLEPRHRFHHTHRRAFTLIIAAAILALIPLALALPAEILRRYLILATLLAAWFALIHLFRRDQPLPKELLTGVFFASAVFTPTLTLHTLPAAVLFALLCTLNCLYIFRWEHPARPRAHPSHDARRPALPVSAHHPCDCRATPRRPPGSHSSGRIALRRPAPYPPSPPPRPRAHRPARRRRLRSPHPTPHRPLPAMNSTPNFDHIARPYRWLEYLTLGPLLERTRNQFLPQLTSARRALILGDGDGRFTAALLQHHPTLTAEAVDLSRVMLSLLVSKQTTSKNEQAKSRLTTHLADARGYTPAHPPDLIVTHFFLDCLTQPELDALIARLSPRLAPGALWLISDFRIPPGPLALPASVYIRALYLAFRILTGLRTTRLPDHASTLHRHGFTLLRQHHRLFGLLTSELWMAP